MRLAVVLDAANVKGAIDTRLLMVDEMGMGEVVLLVGRREGRNLIGHVRKFGDCVGRKGVLDVEVAVAVEKGVLLFGEDVRIGVGRKRKLLARRVLRERLVQGLLDGVKIGGGGHRGEGRVLPSLVVGPHANDKGPEGISLSLEALLFSHDPTLMLESRLGSLGETLVVLRVARAQVTLGIHVVAGKVGDSVTKPKLTEELGANRLMIFNSTAIHAHGVPGLEAEQVSNVVEQTRKLCLLVLPARLGGSSSLNAVLSDGHWLTNVITVPVPLKEG